jgi:hypothetical protein
MLIGVSELWRAAPIIQICARRGLCRRARVGAQKRVGARLSTQGLASWPPGTSGFRADRPMVTGPEYLYIAIMKVVVRFCRAACVCAWQGIGVLRSWRQLLERPRVAVRVAEGNERAPRLNVHVTGLHTAFDKFPPRRLDIRHDNLDAFL